MLTPEQTTEMWAWGNLQAFTTPALHDVFMKKNNQPLTCLNKTRVQWWKPSGWEAYKDVSLRKPTGVCGHQRCMRCYDKKHSATKMSHLGSWHNVTRKCGTREETSTGQWNNHQDKPGGGLPRKEKKKKRIRKGNNNDRPRMENIRIKRWTQSSAWWHQYVHTPCPISQGPKHIN